MREYTATDMPTALGQIKRATMKERLETQKADLTSRLEEVNTALELLEKNPEVNKVLEALSKVTGLY